MDQLATLEYSLGELRTVVASLAEDDMDVASNCEPWTVRRLASHALNNQLRWAGVVTVRVWYRSRTRWRGPDRR